MSEIDKEKIKQEIQDRKFKTFTVGVCKKLNLEPFDLFRVEEIIPQMKNNPFKFTWDILIPLHNELSDDTIQVTDNTPFPEAFQHIISLIQSNFLG
ncbi:MAG: hypothetical protein ACFFG0_05625 [Candidatus Thorarchaeota archaeon]